MPCNEQLLMLPNAATRCAVKAHRIHNVSFRSLLVGLGAMLCQALLAGSVVRASLQAIITVGSLLCHADS